MVNKAFFFFFEQDVFTLLPLSDLLFLGLFLYSSQWLMTAVLLYCPNPIHFRWHKKPLMIQSDWLFAHFFESDCTEYTVSQISISKDFCNKPVLSGIVTGGTSNSLLTSLLYGHFLYWFVTFEAFNSHWMLFGIKGKITSFCSCDLCNLPGLPKLGCENYCCSGGIYDGFVRLVSCVCLVAVMC